MKTKAVAEGMNHFSFAQAILESRAEREGAWVTQGSGTASWSVPRQKGLVWKTKSLRAGAGLWQVGAGGHKAATLWHKQTCHVLRSPHLKAVPVPDPDHQPCQAVTSFLNCTSSPSFAPQPLSPPSALTVPEAGSTRSLPPPCHIQ